MEHRLYLQTLKRALRARGITYEDLARKLRLSESGVKKMLNAKDLSLRRIARICEILGMTPGELFQLSEKSAISTVALSPRQESALLNDSQLLKLFWLITVEKRDLAEVRADYGFIPKVLATKIKELRRLDLIRERRGEISAVFSGKFRFSDDSKLARKLNREWSRLTLDRAMDILVDAKSNTAPFPFHRLLTLRLSDRAFADCLKRFHEVCDDVARVAEREEMLIARREWKALSLCFAFSRKSVVSPD